MAYKMLINGKLVDGNKTLDVFKPAPTTPLTSLLFAEMVADMLPPGVLNIIVDANDLGAVMTKHKDIAKVSFTGSTVTGKKVMESVASGLKRLTLELGGNDAAIVLGDVDVKTVAPKIFDAAMSNGRPDLPGDQAGLCAFEHLRRTVWRTCAAGGRGSGRPRSQAGHRDRSPAEQNAVRKGQRRSRTRGPMAA